MNTQVNNQAQLLQKTTVKQDVCIEFYNLYFETQPDNKKNEGLEGKARTLPDIKQIFAIIEKEFSGYELHRNKKRYIHAIEAIRFQKRSIELLVSSNDTQHQGFVKKNSKSKQRTSIPFLIDEGNETVSHIVIRFDEDNTHNAIVFFERVQGITLKIVENLINNLLEKIRKENNYKEIFEEPYVSDNHTPFYFKVLVNFSPVADTEIIERIQTGNFLDLRIIEKQIEQHEHELPLLIMQESHNIFKPSNIWNKDLRMADIVLGLKKIGRKHKIGASKKQQMLFKLRYLDAGNTRVVELQPEEENLASMCQKKKWFKDYERNVVGNDISFDDTLCRKIFNININDYADEE